MPSWPLGVPHMPYDWTVPQSDRPNLESTMQNGRIRSRRQNTLVIGVVSLSIKMTRDEFAAFKVFVRDDLGRGSAEYTMPVWDGFRCDERRCRLRKGGQYDYGKAGPAFLVSFEMDVYGL